jgi:two-component system LytT family response regulator
LDGDIEQAGREEDALMKPIRVLVADDQPGMRMILSKILQKNGAFEVVGQAEDGKQALEIFERERPEVVFLDVEMPKVDGLECGRQIFDMDPTAVLIYATAHEQYMKQAFEVYAFDYLIKPFKVERVEETLERIRQRAQLRRESDGGRMEAAERRQMGLAKLMIRHKEGVSLVDMEDIILVQREDRATVIYTVNDRIVTSEPLGELMERLDKRLFFRSHKSYIVNLAMVSKVYPYGRWTYVLKLKGTKQDALITYEKFNEMENIFSKEHTS